MKNYTLHVGVLVMITVITSACQNTENKRTEPTLQATSLFGKPLYAPPLSPEQEERLNSNLEDAQEKFDKDPNELNTIWLGRRYAYMSNYNKAFDIHTEGISRFPDSYRLYRHRGHRYISTRQFDKAISDFSKAYALMPKDTSEIEPDGIPNRLNQPLSNTQFNILYHYGLAHYLKGEFEKAEELYEECLEYSGNPDLLVATTDWLYMTLRRQGKNQEAEDLLTSITDSLEIIENDSYYKRLMMYKGDLPIEALFKTDAEDAALSLATQGYGMANWYLYNGDTTKAREIYEQILKGENWSPFGYIAAEADWQLLR